MVDWFAAKGLRRVSCSDSIRSWLAEKGVEATREALIEGGREMRREGGPGILAEKLLESLEGEEAVIDSIRTPAEVEALRSRDDFVLIEVRADEDLRWQRLQGRARSGDPSDRDTFVAQEEAEDEAGQALDATASMADCLVINEGTIGDLEEKVEQFWSEL